MAPALLLLLLLICVCTSRVGGQVDALPSQCWRKRSEQFARDLTCCRVEGTRNGDRRPHGRAVSACLPAIVVAGAQKSGSTALAALLDEHPAIAMVRGQKELHFYSRPQSKTQVDADAALADYLRHFQRLSSQPSAAEAVVPATNRKGKEGGGGGGEEEAEQVLFGESTPSYIVHPHTCARIREMAPDTRILLVLRDPAQRAYSEYMMKARRVLHQEALRSLRTTGDSSTGDSNNGSSTRERLHNLHHVMFDEARSFWKCANRHAPWRGETAATWNPSTLPPALTLDLPVPCTFAHAGRHQRGQQLLHDVESPHTAAWPPFVGMDVPNATVLAGAVAPATTPGNLDPFAEAAHVAVRGWKEQQRELACVHHGTVRPGVAIATAEQLDAVVQQCVRVQRGISDQYLYRGLYAAHISHCLQSVPRDQVFVIRAETLDERPQAVMDRVYAFLGLPPHTLSLPKGKAAVDEWIAARIEALYPHFEANTKWTLRGGYSDPPPELLRFLEDFFAPFQHLAEPFFDVV